MDTRHTRPTMRMVLLGCAIGCAGTLSAQSSAIFQGGTDDGYARGGAAQQISTAGIFSGGSADGYGRNGFAQVISTPGIFAGGTADGYARFGFAQPISSGIFSGGMADGYARNGFAQTINTAGIFSGGLGDGYARFTGNNIKVSIQGIALLEGPWNAGTLLMNDNLRSAGLVPLVEPYTSLGYPSPGGGGGESTTPGTLAQTGPAAVVDWVRVELRNAATPTLLVAAKHALLIRTGGIVDPVTTDDFIELSAPAGDYYVVVRHRNHLGVMTASPIALSSIAAEINFTLSSTATFGNAARKTVGSVELLWAGDVNHDGVLGYTGANNDRDPVLISVGGTTPNNTVSGQYRAEDVNLDGVLKYVGAGNDRDPILVNVGSTTPNNTRAEQVP